MELIPLLCGLAVVVFILIGMAKVFSKAGQPGWAVIVPIYNIYILLKIAGKPGWWLILYLIPLVSLVVSVLVLVELAKAFGKGAGFAIGLLFLPFIFYPILGFGDAVYEGNSSPPPL